MNIHAELIDKLERVSDDMQWQLLRDAAQSIRDLVAERDEYLHRCNALKSLGDMACDQIEIREAALREAKEALIPYIKFVDGTQVKNHAAQVYERINKVLGDECWPDDVKWEEE